MTRFQFSLKGMGKSILALPKWIWIIVLIAFLIGLMFGGGEKKVNGSSEHIHTESSEDQIWTCAMHPQIKLPEPGQCPICFMDLIPLETGETDEGPRELKMSETARSIAEIATEKVTRGKARADILLSGKIVADETRLKTITAWVPGRLEKLYVNFTGTTVKKGDPLLELYSPALYAAQEELLQALQQTRSSGLATESANMVAEAAREKLIQLGLTESQIHEIEIQGTATDRLVIISPISGVVVHKNALEGRYVKKGTQIYTIVDLSQVWVILDAYEKDLAFLKEGQKVIFSAEALKDKTFESFIKFIDPVLDEKTRSVKVRLEVKNRKGLLKPGMFVRATANTEIGNFVGNEQPLLIPASAVLKTGKRAVVYIKKPARDEIIYEGREIEVGPKVGAYYVVLAGLKEGEEVVVKGNFKIDSAMQIRAKPSMMSPEGGVMMTGHEHHGQESSPK